MFIYDVSTENENKCAMARRGGVHEQLSRAGGSILSAIWFTRSNPAGADGRRPGTLAFDRRGQCRRPGLLRCAANAASGGLGLVARVPRPKQRPVSIEYLDTGPCANARSRP